MLEGQIGELGIGQCVKVVGAQVQFLQARHPAEFVSCGL
jgi:hypothetical protein